MDITQVNARELLTLRATLNDALTLTEIRTINWAVVTKAATPAIALGWTGDELARMVIGDLGPTTDNTGAVAVTVLRDLSTVDPPREVTPAPPPIADVLAQMHSHNQPAADPGAWVRRMQVGAP